MIFLVFLIKYVFDNMNVFELMLGLRGLRCRWGGNSLGRLLKVRRSLGSRGRVKGLVMVVMGKLVLVVALVKVLDLYFLVFVVILYINW